MNLTTMQGRLAADLGDAGGATWTADELERAISRALAEYSEACPQRAATTITLSSPGWEIDLSDIDGLCGVERVLYPYDPADPQPDLAWSGFELFPGQVLWIESLEEPAAGEAVRIFYWTAHELEGLDDATATTIPPGDEELIILGATGYAALEKARQAVGAVNVSGYTPLHWRGWAEEQIAYYRRRLERLACQRAIAAAGPIGMDP